MGTSAMHTMLIILGYVTSLGGYLFFEKNKYAKITYCPARDCSCAIIAWSTRCQLMRMLVQVQYLLGVLSVKSCMHAAYTILCFHLQRTKKSLSSR